MKPQEKLEVKRHSAAHIMAAAVLEMFPEAKFGIGPAIENGFYYDFELPRTLIPEDLEIIEEKMRAVVKANHAFEKKVMDIKEAREQFRKSEQPLKVELIDELTEEGNENVTVYKSGQFVDLCSGPHVESAGELDAQGFKLTKISGAYWRGDEKRQQLQRIYGVLFNNKKDLKKYLNMMEEAERRNHRKVGKELELFSNFQEIGQGLPVWLPKGYLMRRTLEDYMIKMERTYGYEHILTPVINRKELFETSGHLEFYKESMYSPIEIDNETFYLKPMNCPAGMMVYKMRPRSYRELPVKMGELGNVHRYEKSGELHGLQRVRGFTQNDAHIFCTPEQLEEQFFEVIEMFEKFFKDVGFTEYKYRLSLSGDDKSKYVGDRERWDWAEEVMRKVLKKNKVEFYEEKDEAAFYGPKIDVQAINVFGKEDSIGTNQIDFNLPDRFDLSYIDESGNKKRPFVIHRALIGSFERFFAFLIEHYAGAFPFWLAPVQVAVLPVSEKFSDYAKEVQKEFKQEDLRVELFNEDDSLGKRIALATSQKIPYVLVVGEKEEKDKSVAVRKRGQKQQETMKLEEFIAQAQREIKEKVIE